MRLAMSILVRDETDIIEENIRFHAANGVDCFIVTDHRSSDGTRDILQDLTRDYDITIIDDDSIVIDRDLCVSRMAHLVRDKGQADWIINNDADEFWFCDLLDLKQAITTELVMLGSDANNVGSIYCERNNMVPSREQVLLPNYTFRHNVFKVVDTLAEHPLRHTWHESHNSTLVQKINGKVISRVNGLTSIGMPLDNCGSMHMLEKTNSHFTRILHYPIRSYTQFETRVINHGQGLGKTRRHEFAHHQRHLKFWYELYLQGELYSEYLSMVLPENALKQLIIAGKIKLEDAFAQSNFSDAA